MRALLFVATLALVGLAAAPASAQAPLNRSQLRNVSPGATVVLRSHAGETRRITTRARSVRQPGRLASRYKNLRVNRTRTLRAQPLRTATPALRTIRTQEGRFVRLNGSHFRVQR